MSASTTSTVPNGSAAPVAPNGSPTHRLRTMNPVKRAVLTIIIIVVAGAAAVFCWRYYQFAVTHESTDDAFIVADVSPISPRIDGHVIAIHAKENQLVAQGQMLVELDSKDQQADVDAAGAVLETAEATLHSRRINVELIRKTTEATIEQAQAGIQASQAAIDSAAAHVKQVMAQTERDRLTAERLNKLLDTQATSQQSVDDAQAALHVSQAELVEAVEAQATARAQMAQADAQMAQAKTAEQQIAVAQAQVTIAEAQVAQAKAALNTAQLQLGYTKIAAPVGGRITKKNLQLGQYVKAGQPMMVIVQDDAWVVANFKETQLTHMRPGQPVQIEIDAYPEINFRGHIDSMQAGSGAAFSLLPPENATGNYVKVVQRMPVKIVFDQKPDTARYLLAPGMSVVPTVDITAPGSAMNAQPRSITDQAP